MHELEQNWPDGRARMLEIRPNLQLYPQSTLLLQ